MKTLNHDHPIDKLISLILKYGEAMYQAGRHRDSKRDSVAGGYFGEIEAVLKWENINLATKREEIYRECLIDLLLTLSENTIHKIEDYDYIRSKVLTALLKAKNHEKATSSEHS